jgi:hypothetical protein
MRLSYCSLDQVSQEEALFVYRGSGKDARLQLCDCLLDLYGCLYVAIVRETAFDQGKGRNPRT